MFYQKLFPGWLLYLTPSLLSFKASAWSTYLLTRGESAISELATSIFGLSSQEMRLDDWGKGLRVVDADFKNKKDKCLTLLKNSLRYNGPESLDDLYLTPLDLVYSIHKDSAHGGYIQL